MSLPLVLFLLGLRRLLFRDVVDTVDVEDVLLLLFVLAFRRKSLLPPAVVGAAYRTNPAPSPKGNAGVVICGRNDNDTNTNGGGRSDREQEGTLQAVTNPGAMDTAIATAIAPESNNSTGILAHPDHGRRHERTNITLVVPYRSIVIVVIRNSKLASRSCSRNLLLIATK